VEVGNIEDLINPFTDVKTADWFYDAVSFAYKRKLFSGMTPTTFEPQTKMNRAMVVTVLWNLEGKLSASSANPFTDLTADWYKTAVVWAASNGIVSGVGNNKFDPNGLLTREQAVTILYNYSKWKGLDVSAAANLDKFTDKGKIHSYALPAIKWAVAKGILNGKSPTTVDPTGTATRAEVAQLFKGYLEKVVG
jgi:hypothetical protein